MALERGSNAAEHLSKSASLRQRILDLADKCSIHIDPKDAFVKHIWSELEQDYQRMADELATACKEELNNRSIQAAVESRVKSRYSIAKSLERREIHRQTREEDLYRDIREILQDLHDLVGIRIIVDYVDHVQATTEFVTQTFNKEKEPNIFSANRKVGRSWAAWFGAYECTNHHVSAKYQEQDPLSYFNGVMFEIQVTSLPANLYNKIAHPLLYKEEAGELSQGDEIVIDLTKGLAFCYSLCTYYKRHKLEGKPVDRYELELMQKASSTSGGPEFMSSISDLAGKIPGIDAAKIKGRSIPRETLEMVLESLLSKGIQSDIGQYVADQLRQEIKDISRTRIELHAFGKARFDSQDVFQSPVCQEGTQIRARESIHSWIKDGKEPLLWICSHAGTGKSTLARTIARELTGAGQIAAGYFFKRGDAGRNYIRHVIPTIAAQLVLTIPRYESCLKDSIDACKNTDFENMLIFEQFRVLLKTPLSQLGHVPSTKVVIIDALDECVDLAQLEQVIQFLVGLKDLDSLQFRLLVTSRDEDPVRAAIVCHPHAKLSLSTTYRDDSISDIESILKVGFQRIKKERRIEGTWPTEGQFREVVHRSTSPSPLFIYATTLLRFLGDGTHHGIPKSRLQSWIEKSPSPTFTTRLDEMYTTVFENLDPDLGPGDSEILTEDEKNTLRTILGAIALAVEPLSFNSLVDILGLDLDALELLKSCRAVLYIPESNNEPVQMLHKSFSDFLLRHIPHKRCWFSIDERDHNEILLKGCIDHLEDKLRMNICDLQDPAVSRVTIEPSIIQKYIPHSLQYASSYWVYHLQKANGTAMLSGSIEGFLCEKFLQWIECLAILGYLDRASSSIEDLRGIYESSTSLERFLYDAYRFLFYIELWQVGTGTHLTRAEISHLVISICWAKDGDNLIVVTEDGHIYRHDFLREHSVVISIRPSELMRGQPVDHVAASPTGVVAMAHYPTKVADYTRPYQVAVWDPYEDKLLYVGESLIEVSAIAISQDSRQVAVVAGGTVKLADTNIGVWSDLATCTIRGAILSFSSDGERIFILEGEAFTIISISTQCFRAVDVPQNGPFTGLAVSPDETSIMTYSDGLLHWNIEYHNPGRLYATLQFKRRFPPDQMPDGSMRIEDTSYTSMITMSPDGQYLVSSWDRRLCLWHVPEGRLYKILIPDDRCPFQYDWWRGKVLSFSRDGTSILAISNDVVCVWVLEQHERSDLKLPAHTAFDFSSVVASYRDFDLDLKAIWMNGKAFAIGSYFLIRVCSIENGSCHSYDVELPNRMVIRTFAFAPGPGLLAVGHDTGSPACRSLLMDRCF
ncbi:hypothetical protein NW768_006724 [Fusarium equiseti]|uniref:RelA/SpoT domain-containing protein n=1 Tax=Fusarium equiseti TaxID=61235 RepID=A0ABQ8R902_FUSEQ|nr:hypothetical protein NW768_006724 [Fusarium equiseti]